MSQPSMFRGPVERLVRLGLTPTAQCSTNGEHCASGHKQSAFVCSDPRIPRTGDPQDKQADPYHDGEISERLSHSG